MYLNKEGKMEARGYGDLPTFQSCGSGRLVGTDKLIEIPIMLNSIIQYLLCSLGCA